VAGSGDAPLIMGDSPEYRKLARTMPYQIFSRIRLRTGTRICGGRAALPVLSPLHFFCLRCVSLARTRGAWWRLRMPLSSPHGADRLDVECVRRLRGFFFFFFFSLQ